MARIGGVHGIRQLRTSEKILKGQWSEALNRGLADLGQPRLPADALELPYWTRLLARGAEHLGPEEEPSLSAEDIAFAIATLEDVVSEEELARVDAAGEGTLGPPQLWPAALTRLMCAYDQRWPRAGEFFVARMREVRLYLYEPRLAERVREFVAEAFAPGVGAVVGHSLGSVIGYDLLRRGEVKGVRTFVSCGSPLAVPTVRRALGVVEGVDGVRWVNAFDPKDVVTGGAGLGLAGVVDVEVDNGRVDPHGVAGYLEAVAGECGTAG
ncbi:hypothetical protein QD712_04945 [Streptomyces acidiscabies]|uniref:hypothetical protein n=1 Tax=Streptomyces acidiscabies TaxID=42234 RepID=UPI0030CC9662